MPKEKPEPQTKGNGMKTPITWENLYRYTDFEAYICISNGIGSFVGKGMISQKKERPEMLSLKLDEFIEVDLRISIDPKCTDQIDRDDPANWTEKIIVVGAKRTDPLIPTEFTDVCILEADPERNSVHLISNKTSIRVYLTSSTCWTKFYVENILSRCK